MLPRRTRRSTSRTAKNPANSLLNPWVSRMNSSANQISPISQPREVARAWLIFPNRPVFAVRSLKPSLRRPAFNVWFFDVQSWAAASGPEYAVNAAPYARVESPACGSSRATVTSPLVELCAASDRRRCPNFRQRGQTGREASVNGISMHLCLFHQKFGPRTDGRLFCIEIGLRPWILHPRISQLWIFRA